MKGQGKKIISLFLICVMMLGVAGPGMEIFAGTTGASVENTEKTVAEAEHDKAAGTAGNNRSFGIGDVAEDSGATEAGKTSSEDKNGNNKNATSSVASESGKAEKGTEVKADEKSGNSAYKKDNEEKAAGKETGDSAVKNDEKFPEFEKRLKAGNGVEVHVHAEKGVFPKGTSVKATPADKKSVIKAAQKISHGKVVTDAAAVDITFYGKDGKSIEPSDSAKVHVRLNSDRSVRGESYGVVHIKDDGTAEKIDDVRSVNAKSANFHAESFSVYGVIGEKITDIKFATYNFNDVDGTTISTQKVKKGDTLKKPQVPGSVANRIFKGWLKEDGTIFDGFGEVGDIENDGEVINLKADYTFGLKLAFLDERGNVIKTVEATDKSEVTIDKFSPRIISPEEELKTETRQSGWSDSASGVNDLSGKWAVTSDKTEAYLKKGNTVLRADGGVIKLYPIYEEGHWVSFDSNGGTRFIDEFVAKGASNQKVKLPTQVLKDGYVFTGWFEDKECTKPYNANNDVTKSLTLYAGWKEAEDTKYLVRYHYEYQKDTSKSDINDPSAWDYKFAGSEIKTGKTGANAELTDNFIFKSPYNLDKNGYELNNDKTVAPKIAADGSTVYDVYYKCKVFTYTFTGRDRGKTKVLFPEGATDYFQTEHKVKYKQNIKFISDILEKAGVLKFMEKEGYNFYSTEGENEQLPPKAVATHNVGSKDRYFGMLKPGKVNSFYNYFFEALDGKAPEGKELVKNVSRRKDNDPVKDRQYYLYLAESFNSYANGAIVINSRGEYPGFRAMPEYSDGHYGSISGGKIGIWFRYHANWTKANQLVDENGNGINYWGEENPVNVYFTRNSYKLNFEIKDGPKVKSDGETLENDFATVKYEKELKQYAPSNYEEGKTKYTSADGRTYTFEGWYTGSDYTMKYDFNDTMPSHDVTLYAKWKPNSLKVTFRTNSEKVKDSSKEVVYGEKVEKPQNPEKDGHVFLGWTLKDKPFSFASPINEDIELVANWRSVKTYKVSYDLNGGTGSVSDNNNYYNMAGVTAANPDSITPPAGKAFIGWKIEGTDEFVYPKEIVKMRVGGIKLVAQWENKKHTTYLKYDYNFNKFGIQESGANYNRIDGVKINTRIDLIPFGNMATAPQGYTFTGWYLDKDCKDGPYDRVLVDTSGNGHNTVYAGWSKTPKTPEKPEAKPVPGISSNPGQTPVPTKDAETTSLSKSKKGKKPAKRHANVAASKRPAVNKPVSAETGDAPRTGDETNILMYALLMLSGGALASVLMILRRRNSKKEK